MAHQKRRPHKEEQAREAKQAVELEKKLRKRERRLEERLEKAQGRRAKALEGFKRAEERLQKRIACVEDIEGRLAIMRGPQIATVAQPSPMDVPGELSSAQDTVAPAEAAELTREVREARAAAEAAEDGARTASERAAEVSSRQELPGAVQHLEQEAVSESVEEIEEEEEVVAAVAAMMIADVAAAAAAEAEAIAEASSARTREARYTALQADQVLEEVRTAIASGALSGDDARRCLQDAEQEVTRANALLADAEATEEQALNAAMNAEAEAEVAEGMAFAASSTAELDVDDVQGLTEPVDSVDSTESEDQSTQPLVDDSELHDHNRLTVRQGEQGEQEKRGAGSDGEDDTVDIGDLHVMHEQGQE